MPTYHTAVHDLHSRLAGDITLERRADLAEGLLEEVTGALQLIAAVALHKLLQVGQPDVAHVRVLEHGHALLIHLEGLLPELVLL